MKAVILAAGEGRRLEPLTNVRPKPMLPIANQPLLEYVVEAVADAGIDEIVLVVGYKRERIQSYFEDGDDWGVDIEYAIQGKQLGTGHAILQARPHVEGDFLVLNGDRIIESRLVERFVDADRDDAALMAVTRSTRPSRYGVVELEDDRVTDIVEKPPTHAAGSEIINAGVYRFGTGVFGAIDATDTVGELAITETLRDRLGDGGVRAINYRGLWLDVSHLWDVVSVTATVLDRLEAGGVHSARVHEDATLAGRVAVGADTSIQPNATVLRGTALGDNVRVGPNAVLSNVVVLDDATVEAGSVLRDCIVGENAHVGPNATAEGGPADVTVEGELHRDVTFGGCLGDNARLGGGVIVAPGAVIGDGATVQSGATVDADVPSDAEVRRG